MSPTSLAPSKMLEEMPLFFLGNSDTKIRLKESKSIDTHGVICETTKLATSDFGICNFEVDVSQFFGSFSLKPTNLTDDIKCSQLVQTGF